MHNGRLRFIVYLIFSSRPQIHRDLPDPFIGSTLQNGHVLVSRLCGFDVQNVQERPLLKTLRR